MLDKNKLLSKRNDDLTQTIQKLEEKLKSLAKENLEMVSAESRQHYRCTQAPLSGGCFDVEVAFLFVCCRRRE